MGQVHIRKIALRWTPREEKKHGRPRNIWCKIVMTELVEMGLNGVRHAMQAAHLGMYCGDVVAPTYFRRYYLSAHAR